MPTCRIREASQDPVPWAGRHRGHLFRRRVGGHAGGHDHPQDHHHLPEEARRHRLHPQHLLLAQQRDQGAASKGGLAVVVEAAQVQLLITDFFDTGIDVDT